MISRRGWIPLLIAWHCTLGLCRAGDRFEESVAPVLRRHCLSCHGTEKQEGQLRLDQLGRNSSDGQQAGRWRDVLDRVESGEMPPEDQPRMTAEEVRSVVDWIKQQIDAAHPARSHWAFQPLAPVVPPAVSSESDWIKNDIDRFIVAKLSDAGLSPSPEADRVTLLRRITLDLIGLPPTPDEVTAFVSDESPEAWERVIDRLLANPHYGERWGRHWLDLAQYADSSGFHNDLDRPYAWKYRDYVIRSFNEDKPYARFVAEQLAGDEVEGANDETLVATGFCRNGPSP